MAPSTVIELKFIKKCSENGEFRAHQRSRTFFCESYYVNKEIRIFSSVSISETGIDIEQTLVQLVITEFFE
uniref:Uncharacterized protein n=1 Tax=Ascaris lumbricoides TaxID=6252 RepID=A0A0M3IGP3_ASCLU